MKALTRLPKILHPYWFNLINKSFTYTRNKIGDKMPPCLIPHVTEKGVDKILFHLTDIVTLLYQSYNMLIKNSWYTTFHQFNEQHIIV